MFSITASWTRPSTWLLAAILTANLLLLLAQLWGREPDAASDTSGGDRPRPADSAPAPERVRPSRARPVDADPGAAGAQLAASEAPVVAPVEVPALLRRTLPVGAPVCRRWGPFADTAEAEALAARLGLDPQGFTVQSVEAEAPPDYLVTVEAPGTRREAAGTAQALKEMNVDSYVLDRPGNVLAVGVFRARSRAESHRRSLAASGFRAAVEPLPRTRLEHHLLARVAADFRPPVPPAGECGDIAPSRQFL